MLFTKHTFRTGTNTIMYCHLYGFTIKIESDFATFRSVLSTKEILKLDHYIKIVLRTYRMTYIALIFTV
jgi:hypothetical protein